MPTIVNCKKKRTRDSRIASRKKMQSYANIYKSVNTNNSIREITYIVCELFLVHREVSCSQMPQYHTITTRKPCTSIN